MKVPLHIQICKRNVTPINAVLQEQPVMLGFICGPKVKENIIKVKLTRFSWFYFQILPFAKQNATHLVKFANISLRQRRIIKL